mgnify:CR=1 FL=1
MTEAVPVGEGSMAAVLGLESDKSLISAVLLKLNAVKLYRQ